ncbi:hypothetical protein DM01DRAFT_1344721 [Hesseltinella vesiculosa]|uniref:Uncharacterized protein n=1 Tax=Hesseltinella vesiculosa TaxID=101127 RepID=A0A1X2GM75_9FUNG|nr:hypothetical protein DM01DRAFT_1344721 [Hesseltinella vesiculosa]
MASVLVVYAIIEQDRQVNLKRITRRAEHEAMEQIRVVHSQHKAIQQDIRALRQLLTTDSAPLEDKEWKRCDYLVVQCNELLTRLLERLDAIRPTASILGETVDISAPIQPLQSAAIHQIRKKKKKVIRDIDRDFEELHSCRHLLAQGE